MEFSVKKFDLLEELSLTQGVVERKTTIPILSNLLCEAKGNRLTITATDLELSIRTSCEAKVKKDGSGTIPAKKLLELVRLLPDEEIRFKLLEGFNFGPITSTKPALKISGPNLIGLPGSGQGRPEDRGSFADTPAPASSQPPVLEPAADCRFGGQASRAKALS